MFVTLKTNQMHDILTLSLPPKRKNMCLSVTEETPQFVVIGSPRLRVGES